MTRISNRVAWGVNGSKVFILLLGIYSSGDANASIDPNHILHMYFGKKVNKLFGAIYTANCFEDTR